MKSIHIICYLKQSKDHKIQTKNFKKKTDTNFFFLAHSKMNNAQLFEK